MRKKLSAVVVLLVMVAAAGAGALFYVGQQAEERFDATLERFSSPPTMTLKKTRYQRQWLGAEAESALEILVGAQTVSLPFKHTITYAPFASGIGEVRTELVVPAPFKPMADAMFKGQSPLTGNTVLNFDGTEVTEFASPSFTLKDPVPANWQGLKGTLTVQGAHLVMNATAPGLKVVNPLANVNVQNLGFNADMTRGADELWLGTGGLQMGRLEVSSALAPAVTAEGLRIRSETAEQSAGLLRSTGSLDLKRLAVQELAFSDMGYEVEVSNLDRAVLAKLSKTMETFPLGGTEPPPELLGNVMKILPSLLKRSPRIDMKRLAIVTPRGDFKAHASALFDGKGELPPQPFSWLTRISVEAKADLSEGVLRWVVEQQMKERARAISAMGKQPLEPARSAQLANELAALRLTRLEQTGALVRNGDRYTIEIRMAEGAVTVNGKDAQQLSALLE